MSKDIPDLSDAGSLDGTEKLEVSKSGASKRTTTAAVAALASARSWACGGSTVDYTAASGWNPAGLDTSTDTSASLGDGTTTPRFHIVNRARCAAVARNANGLRVTLATSYTSGQTWPYDTGAPVLLVPLPTLWMAQVDFVVAHNFSALSAPSGDESLLLHGGLVQQNDSLPPRFVAGFRGYRYAATHSGAESEDHGASSATPTWTSPALDVSASTSGGVTARAYRITLLGAEVRLASGSVGGSLTTRLTHARPATGASRRDYALFLSPLTMNLSAPAGLWCELRSLSITPL